MTSTTATLADETHGENEETKIIPRRCGQYVETGIRLLRQLMEYYIRDNQIDEHTQTALERKIAEAEKILHSLESDEQVTAHTLMQLHRNIRGNLTSHLTNEWITPHAHHAVLMVVNATLRSIKCAMGCSREDAGHGPDLQTLQDFLKSGRETPLKNYCTPTSLKEYLHFRKNPPPDVLLDDTHNKTLKEGRFIFCRSADMLQCIHTVEGVADEEEPVLLRGQTGTGKELMARLAHESSKRRDKPFIPIQCGAIPINLIISEFFGHEKGAFTGADKPRIGRFEQAADGVLFLDEIGVLENEVQQILLRVLEERKFIPVGGTRVINFPARIIAATNANLEQMVRDGRFREDLYYRLKGQMITLPPLHRRADRIPLMQDILQKRNKDVRLSSDALQLLGTYPFPGNIREARNTLLAAESAVDRVGGKMITPETLYPLLDEKTLEGMVEATE